ncbi:MAG: helix-turn-helix domain-containing protein [Candidatus Paceibacterota bacterium]
MHPTSISPADLRELAKMVAGEVVERMAGRPRLVDGLELAEICGVSLATIERAKAAGEIPFIRFGSRIKYDVDSVIAARAKNAQRPTADEQTESPVSALERARARQHARHQKENPAAGNRLGSQ